MGAWMDAIHIHAFLLSAYLSVCGFNVQLPSKQVKYVREIETIYCSNRPASQIGCWPITSQNGYLPDHSCHHNFATQKPRTIRIVTQVMRNPPMIDTIYTSIIDSWRTKHGGLLHHQLQLINPYVSDSRTKSLRFRILLAEKLGWFKSETIRWTILPKQQPAG